MTTALIVVDTQNDFLEGGRLAVAGGAQAARGIAELVATSAGAYDLVVATRDWHTPDTHGHFAADGDDPDFNDTWPVHCMAGTPGAQLSSWLADVAFDAVVDKGQTDAAYSGFEGATADGRTLADILRAAGVDTVHVVGVAYDFCVAQTALDAVTAGFDTTVLTDLAPAVDAPTGTGDETTVDVATRALADAGVTLATSRRPAAA